MKRRIFLERAAQVAAGLGLGGWAATKVAPVAAPVVDTAAIQHATVVRQALLQRPLYPDLIERGIRQVYFSNYFADQKYHFALMNGTGEPDRVLPGLGRMPRQAYLNRLLKGTPAKRRRK